MYNHIHQEYVDEGLHKAVLYREQHAQINDLCNMDMILSTAIYRAVPFPFLVNQVEERFKTGGNSSVQTKPQCY